MTDVDDSRGGPVVNVGGDAVLSVPDRKPESVHEGVPLSDLRRQARQVYRESLAAGGGLSGKALGELFGRSERWGRERIAETRSTLPPLDHSHFDGKGGGPGAAAASESEWRPVYIRPGTVRGARPFVWWCSQGLGEPLRRHYV
jgi:hypothetical protein